MPDKLAYEVKNAVIDSATITSGDHGFLSSWIVVDYGGSSQGFGGYVLYLPTHHKLESVAGHFIWRCMEIAGCTEWSKMVGKTIRVRIQNGVIVGIGHIVKNDWFIPKEDFENF